MTAKLERKIDKLEMIIVKMIKSFSLKFRKIDEKFDKMDERFDKMDDHFEKIDKKLFEHDGRFDLLANKLFEHDNRLKSIEENMATKEDIRRIWRVLEMLSTSSERHDTELLCINESINRIEIKIEEHDKILK